MAPKARGRGRRLKCRPSDASIGGVGIEGSKKTKKSKMATRETAVEHKLALRGAGQARWYLVPTTKDNDEDCVCLTAGRASVFTRAGFKEVHKFVTSLRDAHKRGGTGPDEAHVDGGSDPEDQGQRPAGTASFGAKAFNVSSDEGETDSKPQSRASREGSRRPVAGPVKQRREWRFVLVAGVNVTVRIRQGGGVMVPATPESLVNVGKAIVALAKERKEGRGPPSPGRVRKVRTASIVSEDDGRVQFLHSKRCFQVTYTQDGSHIKTCAGLVLPSKDLSNEIIQFNSVEYKESHTRMESKARQMWNDLDKSDRTRYGDNVIGSGVTGADSQSSGG